MMFNLIYWIIVIISNWLLIVIGVPGETKVKKSTGMETNIHGLSPYSNYSFKVLGFTSSGDGVESIPIYCFTKEDGN